MQALLVISIILELVFIGAFCYTFFYYLPRLLAQFEVVEEEEVAQEVTEPDPVEKAVHKASTGLPKLAKSAAKQEKVGFCKFCQKTVPNPLKHKWDFHRPEMEKAIHDAAERRKAAVTQ